MNFRSFGEVLKSRRILVIGFVIVALAFTPFIGSIARPTYTATSEISYVGNGTEAIILPADLPELATSSKVVERAISASHISIDPEDFLLKLSVRESPHSDIIPIAYRSKDQQVAIKAANAVADATVSEYKKLGTRQYDEIIGKLQSQLGELRGQISGYNARYQASVKGDPMAGTAAGIDALATHLDTVDLARAQAHAKLAQDLASSRSLGAGSASAGFGSVIREETLEHDPTYTALQIAQAKDRADYESVKAGYTTAYPGLAGAEEKVRIESASSAREAAAAAAAHRGASPTYAAQLVSKQAADSLVAGDRAQVAQLDQQYTAIRSRLNDLPKLTVPADEQRLQRDGATAAYTLVETRLRTALADKVAAESLNSIVVLNYAPNGVPNFSPLVAASVIVLLICGLALGVAYLAEFLDPRIRTRTDVEGLYGSPLIGSL